MSIALAFAFHTCIAARFQSFRLGNNRSGYSMFAVYLTNDDVLKNPE